MKNDARHRMPSNLLASPALHGEIRRYAAGEPVLNEGDLCDALYVLVSGQLTVFTEGPKQRELIYNVLEPGEFFGEMSLDGEARSASVRAAIDSECIVIKNDRVRALLREEPAFAEALVMKLIGRLRQATGSIRSLALEGVYERTIRLLEHTAVAEGDVFRIPPGLTQTEIASRIGATREMVNHVMRDLIRGGFIAKLGNRRMTIVKALPRRW